MKKLLLALFICAFLSISLNSFAQEYLITFTGTGAATTVSSVEVENLSTGAATTLNGDDILHLTSVVGISQLEKNNSSGMRIYPNPMMDNSILALHPPIAGDAVITVYEMTGKIVAQIHAYLENSRQEFRLTGLKNGMYLINITGNTFQYSGKILSGAQADGNPGIEKVSNTTENNIEKVSKKEFSETQSTVDMYYTAGERLKFKASSGIYSTIKTDIPAWDKTLSFNFIPCTDGDNNNYPVVEIGSQYWMAENLKTTKYNDGIDIPLVADGTAWAGLSTPGYCWYNNDEAANKTTYGALYNWYTVNTGKLCPTGWHVPNEAEWTVLTDYHGGEGVAGGKLKEAGMAHWLDPNTDATNETGFTALSGGYRTPDRAFGSIGVDGVWWSSAEMSSSIGFILYLYNDNSRVDRGGYEKAYGLSIRCMRDE